MKHVPVIQGYTAAEVKDYVRRERARCMLNAFFALLTLLVSGWLYAQIVRLMGAPSPVIGATAVGVQFVTGICAMAAKLGEHFVGVVKCVGKVWRLFRKKG